ncbi:UNVERIFIED_CONTAM: hypothetical protein RMT77_019796 [Armadillidium vulgare]
MEGATIVSEAVSEVAPAVVTIVSSQGVKRCAGKFGPKISCRIFSFCRRLWKGNKTVIVATVAVVALIKVHRIIKKRNCRKEWNAAGKDIVVLHAFPKAITLPNLSPFVLKLETYFRMADIQYKLDDRYPFGPKGKVPWITLNGKDYADSQLIMEFLGKEFSKDFSNSLSKEEKAVSRAMQIMAEEHLLWGLAWWRFVVDRCEVMSALMEFSFFEFLFMKSLIKKIRKTLWLQGIGRHSDHEKIEIVRKDIEAISNYLGTKKFLNGDIPCETDCSLFGFLCQCVWGMPGSPFEAMVKNDYPNLLQYCYRMKEKFWPDWEQ